MIQSEGVICDIPIFGNIWWSRYSSKFWKNFLDKHLDKFDKEFITSRGSGITLTNNEIKDIIKVSKSLENRGILLKGTTRKITTQQGGFLNFLRPLITAGLQLMKSVLTPLAKSILLAFELSAAMSATDAAIPKRFMDQELQH